jgi:hypothetical protein
MKQLKNIVIFLHLALFLSPGVIKIFHEHSSHVHELNASRNNPVLNGKCLVCDFEISIFNTQVQVNPSQKITYFQKELILCSDNFISNPSRLTQSLRAPPIA